MLEMQTSHNYYLNNYLNYLKSWLQHVKESYSMP